MNLDLPQIGGVCQDFTRWWNDIGQFLPPMGEMDGDFALEFSKRIAQAVYADTRHLISEAQGELETYKQEYAVDKTELDDSVSLIKQIEDIVEITLSSKDKSIKTLIEDYRENHQD